MGLDKYDQKLLYQLDADSRQSYVQLARKVGLSKDAVKYRIDRYLKQKLLDGFYTLVDSSKLGYYSFRIYFSFKNTKLEEEEKIINYLHKHKNVFYLFRAEGKFDCGFGYFAKSLFEFDSFIRSFKEKFNQIRISHQGLFIYLQHFDRNYLINRKRLQKPKRIIQEPQQILIDKNDKIILNLITNDARIQIVDICKKVNLTSKAVIYRMRNLERKGVILGYKAKLNLDKIGYSMYKVDIVVDDRKITEKIKSYLFQLPNIIHSEEVFGGSDIEFDIECMNYSEFRSIINTLKDNFGDQISDIFHFRTTRIYKTLYLPK